MLRDQTSAPATAAPATKRDRTGWARYSGSEPCRLVRRSAQFWQSGSAEVAAMRRVPHRKPWRVETRANALHRKRDTRNVFSPQSVICPSGSFLTGLSSLISDFPKNISVPTYPKSILELSPSWPTEGRFAIVTDVGHGMRWTRQRFARDGVAGRVERLVSDQQRADERCCSVRRSRVVLTPRRWRQVRGCYVGPTGLRHNVSPWTTVAKEPGHRGEHEGNR